MLPPAPGLFSGLTKSYLSKIERGQATPSISAALKIAKAIGIPVERLFGEPTGESAITIVRRAKATSLGSDTAKGARKIQLIAGGASKAGMLGFLIFPPPAPVRGYRLSDHQGEELLYILSGTIELRLGSGAETLHVGDCALFDARVPHRLVSVGKESASALVVVAPG